MDDIIEMVIIDNEYYRFSMITSKGNSCLFSVPKNAISIINFDIKAGTCEFVKDVSNIKSIVERAFKKHDLENKCIVIPLLPKDYTLVSISDFEELMKVIDLLFLSIKDMLTEKNMSYENIIGIVNRKDFESFELFIELYKKSTENIVQVIDLKSLYKEVQDKPNDVDITNQLSELYFLDSTLSDQPIIVEDVSPIKTVQMAEVIPIEEYTSGSNPSEEKGRSRTLVLPGIKPQSYEPEEVDYSVTRTGFDNFYTKAGHVGFKLIIALGIILYLVIIGVILTK